jgi:hypothetical protein
MCSAPAYSLVNGRRELRISNVLGDLFHVQFEGYIFALVAPENILQKLQT